MGSLSTIHPALPDASTLVANAATLILFGSIVVAGIMKGLKEARELFPKRDPATPNLPTHIPDSARVEAATILENMTLSEWTHSNKEVRLAVDRLCGVLASLHDEVADLRRSNEDIVHQMKLGGRT